MMPLLRAEFRKLYTVRSTYVLTLLAVFIIGLYVFYAGGYKGVGAQPYWLSSIFDHTADIAMFAGLIGVLLMGHEYRHNTIMYTLTSANSRTKVLLAKIITILAYSAVLTAVAVLVAMLGYQLGVSLSPTASFSAIHFFWSDLWQAAFFVASYGLVGLLLAFLFRNVVGAIASLFIIPTIEVLSAMILRGNSKYLPFMVLGEVHNQAAMSAIKAAFLFTVYLIVGWLIAWRLFLHRDAN